MTYLLADSQAGGQPPGVADAQPHEGSLDPLPLGPCGWPRLGTFRARLLFSWPSGLPGNVFRGRAAVFHFRQSTKCGGRSLSLGRLSEHFRDRNALGFARRRTSKLVGRAATQLNKPLRLLHESLLSGRSFLAPCAQKLATTLCPCNISPAVRQFVLVAARRFLQSVTYFVGRSARAPSRRFAFAAFDLLICAGVEAGPW